MTNPVTVLAPIKLGAGKTEADLLAASDRFEKEFASRQPGILRRELVRKAGSEYVDIVQFRSAEDLDDVMAKEKESPACHEYFSVMDLTDADDCHVAMFVSLATYT